MKAPKEIYLQVDEEGYESMAGGTTWCQDRINDTDVKYIRADCNKPNTDSIKIPKIRPCQECGGSFGHDIDCCEGMRRKIPELPE